MVSMLIECPSCSTQFSVPDKALGAKGRTLKCAKCAHKWFQAPAAPEPSMAEDSYVPEPALGGIAQDLGGSPDWDDPVAPSDEADGGYDGGSDNSPDDTDHAMGGAGGGGLDQFTGFNMALEDDDTDDDRGSEFRGYKDPDAPDEMPDIMSDNPEPIPNVFTAGASQAPEKKGAGGLIVLMVVLVLGGLGGAGLYFQDKVVALWPQAGEVYSALGLRRDVLGDGLIFRNTSSSRSEQNGVEILVVRGVIANGTDQERPIPFLRLGLYDDTAQLQEKIVTPPVEKLDPNGTVAFRITIEEPNAAAVRFELKFTDTPGEMEP